MEKQGQSILDVLRQTMPSWRNVTLKSNIDTSAANTLFSLWRTGQDKVSNKIYKKPHTLSKYDVDKMKNAGFIKLMGDNIEITDKGSKVIRTMILGDSRSVYEDDGSNVDYNKAEQDSKEVKTAKKTKIAQGWWDRFE